MTFSTRITQPITHSFNHPTTHCLKAIQRCYQFMAAAIATLTFHIQHTIDITLQAIVATRSAESICHPCGYTYCELLASRFVEVLVMGWHAGTGSQPHSHKACLNLTKVLSGQVLERKYHLTGGQLTILSERIVHQGQWAWILPYEIHELIGLDSPAQTLHFYFPKR